MGLSQKELELATVRASLEKLKICSDPALVEDEPPDVEFLNDGRRFGVEVTHYHQSRLIRGKFPRRQIEMHWEDFREFAFDYLNDSYPELLCYNVLLQFRDLNVPKKEDWQSFVDDVAGLLERNTNFVGTELTEIQTWNAGPLLSKHLHVLYASKWELTGRWDSDICAGSVGVTEEELIEIVRRKSERLEKSGFDESWLLVAGGSRVSGTIAAFSAERLNSFDKLSETLATSRFDQVHVFDIDGYFFWTYGSDWQCL